MRFADVILPVPFETFTYAVPPQMEGQLGEGSRVWVELGKTKRYAGVVLRVHDVAPQGVVIKSILEVLDEQPMVTPSQLRFWQWVAAYYMSPLGDVYKAARGNKNSRPSPLPLPVREGSGHLEFTLPQLTPAQQAAYDSIWKSWGLTPNKDGNYAPPLGGDGGGSAWGGSGITLLHGVTSSGKTEIYMHLIRDMMVAGKQVLYLLPEIALTTQMMERLHRVFGNNMVVYHSKFTDRQREEAYRRVATSAPLLILGVRSSVFLPFHQLGLVIVDEEHEPSYKQQEPAPRYHARSAAIMLARQMGAKVLLGTATPSLETLHLARQGRYGYVRLTQRYADMQLPAVEVVDIARLKFQKRMQGAFSPQLLEAMAEALERGEQVILFQNRRGFSSFIQCRQCGWVPRCERCDVSLTYHKRLHTLSCHYCGKSYPLPERCPQCGETFISVGAGTERIEEQVRRLFPEARVARMDLDTATTRKTYEQLIGDFAAHRYDILIGTQMVSKGLDFDRVSVVGILDADTLLNQPDFRAHERTFHLLMQVAGRAGRKGRQGRVVLQTRTADSPVIRHVVAGATDTLYEEQMEERTLFRYPPVTRLIYIYLRHRDALLLDHAAEAYAALLRRIFSDGILGPDRPPVSRVASLHIRKIILKIPLSASVTQVRQSLLAVQQQMLQQTYCTHLNIYYDVDPV